MSETLKRFSSAASSLDFVDADVVAGLPVSVALVASFLASGLAVVSLLAGFSAGVVAVFAGPAAGFAALVVELPVVAVEVLAAVFVFGSAAGVLATPLF